MRKRLLAVILLVGLLVGCATVPTSGPVEEIPPSAQPGGIDIAPEPPADDVTPTRLVEGYLQAMADPEDDYLVARQYLTRSAARSWNPKGAIVFQGSLTGSGDSASLVGTQIGQVGEAGRYTSQQTGLSHDFGIVREEGQWRISTPPTGLLLSRYIFERYYSQVSLYFMSRGGSHVVPDPVHIPEALVTPDRIVEALIAGPDPALRSVVTNALPAEAELGSRGASIDAHGVVTVDLTNLSEGLDDDARRKLGAQLVWSLTAVPRLSGVIVTRDGVPYALPGSTADGVLELGGQQGYQVLSRGSSAELYGLQKGRAVRIGGQELEPVTGSDVPEKVVEAAFSVDGINAAFIEQGRRKIRTGSLLAKMTNLDLGLTNLRSPQFVLGEVWVLGDDESGSTVLLRIDRQANVVRVTNALPGPITSYAVSPTGARVALIFRNGSTSTLAIATLANDSSNLEQFEPLVLVDSDSHPLEGLHSVVWQAESSLAIVAGDGDRSVFTCLVDGSGLEELGPIGGEISQITAMARLGGGPIAVRTNTNAVWRFEARTRWTRIADDLSAITYSS